MDRKFSWVSKNTTEQSLGDDSPDFSVTWVPDRVFPRLRFRASRLLDAGTYTVGLTSSKLLELPAAASPRRRRTHHAGLGRGRVRRRQRLHTDESGRRRLRCDVPGHCERRWRTYVRRRPVSHFLKFALGPGRCASAGDVITCLGCGGSRRRGVSWAPSYRRGASIVENAIQLTVLSDDDVGGGVSRVVTVSNLVLAQGGVAQNDESITLTSSATQVPTTAIPVRKTTAVAGISDVAWTCLGTVFFGRSSE